MTSRRRRFNSQTIWKGVYADKSKGSYRAYITVDGKRKHLGWYDDPMAAALAVDHATRRLYGRDGRYNLPRPGERSAL